MKINLNWDTCIIFKDIKSPLDLLYKNSKLISKMVTKQAPRWWMLMELCANMKMVELYKLE